MEKATEVRETLDRMYELDSAEQMPGFPEDVEEMVRLVVEEGTFTPDKNISAGGPLTLKQRLKGRFETDVSPVFMMGMLIGASLERDVPMDSDLEDKWQEGEFTLPEKDNE